MYNIYPSMKYKSLQNATMNAVMNISVTRFRLIMIDNRSKVSLWSAVDFHSTVKWIDANGCQRVAQFLNI